MHAPIATETEDEVQSNLEVCSQASGDSDGQQEVIRALPKAWSKLNSLTYTRDGTGEKLSFPAGLTGLLKAISNVLNYCVGTGDLAVRESM